MLMTLSDRNGIRIHNHLVQTNPQPFSLTVQTKWNHVFIRRLNMFNYSPHIHYYPILL